MKNIIFIQKKIRIFGLIMLLMISLGLIFLVFYKARPNFPVIIKSNDLGINFLSDRYSLWLIPLVGLIFIGINSLLMYFLRQEQENLRKLLFSVNILITVIIFIISIQVYILNR
jgi:hypothetical protein